ncbi:hypothetical protein EDF62_3278 [Leucobacter luti]|uniref:Uncharacterized protein n=1 Tax=Leucobacter luti TaxID=340320 RepID=A0A4R6RTA2_9MICO|nr:hypothetical protein [Leucobacter luti]TDP89547.1 hypothetical protein EDF62_3278 [Leucobacter luti]
MSHGTHWAAEPTYMPGEYVVVPDGDLRWAEWSPKFGRADAQLTARRLNERGASPEKYLSALSTLEKFTPTTTIQVIEQIHEEEPRS